MKDFLKKYAAIIFTMFGVGAVGLLWYSLLWPDPEGGFLTGCWQNHRFIFADAAEENGCKDVETVKWSKSDMPLRVAVAARTDGELREARITLKNVVADMNRDVDFTLLRVAGYDEKYDVHVIWNGAMTRSKQAGTCSFRREMDDASGNYKMRMVGMVVVVGGTAEAQHRTLYHELGHCGAGLAHDNYKASAMYTNVTTFEDVPFFGLSDHDVKLLRGEYR